jgi:hypothetical protein
MPSVSTLFWASVPLVVCAVIFQLGLPSFVTKLVTDSIYYKVALQLFSTTHCYISVKTLSPGLPQAECFSVSNGKFSRVFLDETSFDVTKQARTGHVIPGLWDGHGHLLAYGESLDSVDLFGANSMDTVKERLLKYRAGREEVGTAEHWLRGVGWDQANFKGKWPTAVSVLSLFYLCSVCQSLAHLQFTAYLDELVMESLKC